MNRDCTGVQLSLHGFYKLAGFHYTMAVSGQPDFLRQLPFSRVNSLRVEVCGSFMTLLWESYSIFFTLVLIKVNKAHSRLKGSRHGGTPSSQNGIVKVQL